MEKSVCPAAKISRKGIYMLLLFFLEAVIYAYLIKDIDRARQFPALIQGLKWVYYICFEISLVILGWNILKRHIALEDFLKISGIFVVLQYAGITFIKLFNLDTPILILDILQGWQFFVPFLVVAGIAIFVDHKNFVSWIKTHRIVFLAMLYLLILPAICSVNSFIYGAIVDGRTDLQIASLLNALMLTNMYIRPIYYASVGLLILIIGIGLLAGKISVLEYLSLGGGYIILQYLGITGIDACIGLLKEFSSSNLNMVLHILLDYKYIGLYFGFIGLSIIRSLIIGRK